MIQLYIHIYYFSDSFPLLKDIKYRSLCYTVGPYGFSFQLLRDAQ